MALAKAMALDLALALAGAGAVVMDLALAMAPAMAMALVLVLALAEAKAMALALVSALDLALALAGAGAVVMDLALALVMALALVGALAKETLTEREQERVMSMESEEIKMRRFRDPIAAANYAQQNDFEIGEHVLEDPQDRWFYVGTQEQLTSIPCTDIYGPEQIFEENSQFGIRA